MKNLSFLATERLMIGPLQGSCPGLGGSPLYGAYSYVRPQRVWFTEPSWLLNRVLILAILETFLRWLRHGS